MDNKEAIEILRKIALCVPTGVIEPRDFYLALDLAIKALEEKPNGEWKHIGGDEWCCSECGRVITTEGSWENPLDIGEYHCPNCGTDMRGAE